MSAGNQPRTECLRRLHLDFLDGATAHPRVYHLCAGGIEPETTEFLVSQWDNSHAAEELWDAARMFGDGQWGYYGEFLKSPGYLRLGSLESAGRFVGDPEDDDAIADFIELSEGLLPHIEDLSEHPRVASAPWLETMYALRDCTTEVEEIGNTPNGSVVGAMGLRWNVFRTSARAIELLLDRLPSDAAIPLNRLTDRFRRDHDRNEATTKPQQPRRRPGRPPDTDFEEDKRVFDAWNSGRYRTYEELGRILEKSGHEVKCIVDRHTKRVKKRESSE